MRKEKKTTVLFYFKKCQKKTKVMNLKSLKVGFLLPPSVVSLL